MGIPNLHRTVFETLHLLISFGHETPERDARLDPPTNYFQVFSTLLLHGGFAQH